MNRDVVRQVLFVNASKGAQEIAQAGPKAFDRVGVNFTNSIAILMASHDLNLAGAFADRLLLLSEGNLIADGTPSEVLKPELLERVYGVAMARTDFNGRPIVYPVVKA